MAGEMTWWPNLQEHVMNAARHEKNIPSLKMKLIESRLAGTLKPISPRRDFVNRLGEHIHSIRPLAIVNRVDNIHYIVALLAGFVSLGVLLVLGLRALASFLGRKPLSHT
jgi:hypothetical protein